jgi:hypothetical protein
MRTRFKPLFALMLAAVASVAFGSTYVVRVSIPGLRATAADSLPSGPSSPPAYSFAGATFTPCGAVNNVGPTAAQCKTAYSGYAWASNSAYFNVGSGSTQGFQYWTVPQTGAYTFNVAGAAGAAGAKAAGSGAIVRGTLQLSQGEVLTLVVGQTPGAITNHSGGGGGGTFVYEGPTLLFAAGGGGGGATVTTNSTASVTTAGTSTSGATVVSSFGGGGAGVGGDGVSATDGSAGVAATGGASFSDGFGGGVSRELGGWVTGAGYGGFGGGGGACSCSSGGGGGGGGYGGGNGGGGGFFGGAPGTSYLGTAGSFTGSINPANGYVTVSAPN